MVRGRKAAAAAMVMTFLTAAVLTAAAPVGAAPGGLDALFGTAGVVGPLAGTAEAVIDAGGKVITVSSTGDLNAGTLIVRRRLATGAADTTFSGDGEVTLTVPGNPTTASVAVDSGGKVVVATGLIGSGPLGYQVYRLTEAGAPDTTFSTDGIASIDNFGVFAVIVGVGVQPDGDVIVGMGDTVIFGGFGQIPRVQRIADDGTLSTAIDLLPDYTTGASRGATLSVDSLGRTYVMTPADGKVMLWRYTEALALDTTFSADGKVDIRRPGGTSDNRTWGGALGVSGTDVLVAATFGTRTGGGAVPPVDVEAATLVARLTLAGAPDTTFSGDGVALLSRPTGSIESSTVGRTASGGASVVAGRTIDNVASGLVWELTKGGYPSTAFSTDGRAERPAYPTASGIGANGTRVRLFEDDETFTNSSLVSMELDAVSDASKPVTTTSQPTARWTLTATVPAAWSATDTGTGVASYDVYRRGGAWNGSLPVNPTALLSGTVLKTTTFASVAGTTYCLKARARDKANNLGAFSAERCTAVPLRSNQLTYTGTWTTANLTAAYGGSYKMAATVTARATRSGIVGARRIALVATRCTTCGAVRVYWNGVLVKTVSLVATSTQRRAVVELLAFATPTSGTLTLQVATAGKPVIIEGLGITKSST